MGWTTGAALSSASGVFVTSMDKSKDGTGDFLIRAAKGVWGSLGGNRVLNPNGKALRVKVKRDLED